MSKIFPCYVKPHTAFPGGYSILYLDQSPRGIGGCGDVLCPKCAEELHAAEPRLDLTPFIHWEGPADQCANCNKDLPSEYGDQRFDRPVANRLSQRKRDRLDLEGRPHLEWTRRSILR